MKVLRFVNPHGNGVYQDGFDVVVGLEKYGLEIPTHQPVGYEDLIGFKWDDLTKYLYAFKTPDQLISWFRYNDPLEIFIHGGQLLEVEVPDTEVLTGRCQCAYLKGSVINHRVIDVDEFIELVEPAMVKWKEWLTW